MHSILPAVVSLAVIAGSGLAIIAVALELAVAIRRRCRGGLVDALLRRCGGSRFCRFALRCACYVVHAAARRIFYFGLDARSFAS